MPFRQALLVATSLSLAVATTGCRPPWEPAPPPSPRATCVALFDVSGSTQPVRARQGEGFDRMLADCRGLRARVWAGRITGNTLAGDVAPIDVALLPDKLVNPTIDGKVVDRKVAAARREADALLATPPRVKGSDVYGALLVAARAFERAPAGPRRLVLFTDGISTQPPLDLEHAPLRRRADVDALVARVARRGMPKLAGVEVTFAGAGLFSTLSSPRLARIEALYRALVERAGGRLVAFDQGTSPATPTSAAS